MFPIVAGLLLGGVMGGGIAALQKKDLIEGALMGAAGGALGGILMPGAGAAGALGGETVSAATAAAGNPGTFIAADQAIAAAAPEAGIGSIAHTANPAATGGTGIFGGAGGIGNFLSANKGALMGGGLGGMMASANEPKKKSEGNIYDMSFSQERNPLFGQPGEPAFINQGYTTNSITPVEDYEPTMTAANGGIIALAEGGDVDRYLHSVRTVDPAVAEYNAKLMERANQQYNINLPPAPNQVPGSVGYIAPFTTNTTNTTTNKNATNKGSISGLIFNPITRQYEGEFIAPGKKKKTLEEEKEVKGGYQSYESSGGDVASGPDGNDDGSDSGGNNDGGPGAGSDAGGDSANGGLINRRYNIGGGISSLGAYSDGGQLLRGPGDGVSDDIPAQIGARQPARLADGEFVVPARVVSELGNGSTDAGAKRLYAMMDRVQNNRRKSVGKGKVAVDSKAYKHLPA